MAVSSRMHPECERRVVEYDDGTKVTEETRFDKSDRPIEGYELWARPRGISTERTVSFTYGDDGRLLTMKQKDRGFDDGGTRYESGADMEFEHGPHGEVVLQRATGDQRTTTFTWEGTFRPGAAIVRPTPPWERTHIFSLSMPQDLRLRDRRSSMPPFVFEGTVTSTSEQYGVEAIVTYDQNGRMTKHVARIAKFVREFEYDAKGLLQKTTGDDGRVITYRYDGLSGVEIAFDGSDGAAVEIYERDESGRFVRGVYERGSTRILTSFGRCQKL